MNFNEKVRLHNEGQYNLVDELLDLALGDSVRTELVKYYETLPFWNIYNGDYTITFERWRPKYRPLKDEIEYRLAYNFRTIFYRHSKPALKLRKTHLFEGDNHDINEETDPLAIVYKALKGIGHEYFKDDFDKVNDKMLDMVAEKYGSDYFYEFYDTLVDFQSIIPYINRDRKKYHDEIRPLMEKALNHMLLKVDLSKTEDNIVGYIAKGVRNLTYKQLDKLYNVRTFNRNGKRYFLKEDDLILEGADDLINCKKSNPTASQKEFIEELKEVINEEFLNRNTDHFYFDDKGEVNDFNKRYFAEKMNMSETNFKHKLKRLRV